MVAPSPATTDPPEVRRDRWVATLRTAKKFHWSSFSQEPIRKGDYYYSITLANSGLRGAKIFPSRVLPWELEAYWEKGERNCARPLKGYRIEQKVSHIVQSLVYAPSAEEACQQCGWLIEDCFVSETGLEI